MSTNQYLIQVGGTEVTVVYKKVKNLHLNVLPPIGKVRVTAPHNMKEDIIRTFLASRLSWIKKMQSQFRNQDRQTPREYISGETFYYFGKKLKLQVQENNDKNTVEIRGKTKLILTIKPKASLKKRDEIIQNWYREQLREFLELSIGKWQKKIGVKTKKWGIRRMKTRWGSCNYHKKIIWLNLELAKKPERCIEYVVVHELLHLIENSHNEKFIKLLDRHLPNWRNEKEELNRLILTYEEWKN